MNTITKQAVDLMEMLPEQEQNFALEFIKRLVLAWDPDYTKLTIAETEDLKEAEKSILEEGTISHTDINW